MTFGLPMVLPVLVLAPLAWLVLRVLDRARAERLARLVGPRVRALTGVICDLLRVRASLMVVQYSTLPLIEPNLDQNPVALSI